ncbi:hypothetical protein BV924_22955 [Pectobacterium odoriferum]|uniref:Uncharacterized protein n=1 Tax=Pectobacterium odoriferum TaxID=78398 RepID=A0ABD6VKB3_9GAMM|nr:hypothetical protein [Pectobacterium odoriferum]POD89245.1 hypothetical protein BV925_23095 [Pectobacterium odoriferum]POD90686.1 hypothetical protein BVY06_23040 [Pectobacterium odoriferum]POD96650.1 hypothetical protein BVY05_22695 [Pectobacterium odoriferum]POE07570.1 hypothetical protein BV924_22955 [Pectobacterium odoriferum]POE21702.1 hypothetical protein BV926_22865 [Pectobacterium odoriferum]
MIFNKILLIVSIYTMVSFNSWGAYYNTVKVGRYVIGLSKNEHGVVDIYNADTKITSSCKIGNWEESFLKGAGELSLTSDNESVLVAFTNKFFKIKELENCINKPVKLRDVQYADRAISRIIDINFEKKLILALVVIDTQSMAHQAIVSEFNGKKSILSGKGFWDPTLKNVDVSDETFPVDYNDYYQGKISVNGKYVAPNDLDCSVDSFPGVWDIEKKMKVSFPEDKDDAVIDRKCKELFSGDKTLNELGGNFINTK